MKTPDEFMEYFRRNYPGPDTIIHNPDWHAPRIYVAAIHASAHSDLLKACKALRLEMDSVNVPSLGVMAQIDAAIKKAESGE